MLLIFVCRIYLKFSFTVNCEGLQKSQLSRVFSISASAHSLPFAPPGHRQAVCQTSDEKLSKFKSCSHMCTPWLSMDVKPNLQIGETSANNQRLNGVSRVKPEN